MSKDSHQNNDRVKSPASVNIHQAFYELDAYIDDSGFDMEAGLERLHKALTATKSQSPNDVVEPQKSRSPKPTLPNDP